MAINPIGKHPLPSVLPIPMARAATRSNKIISVLKSFFSGPTEVPMDQNRLSGITGLIDQVQSSAERSVQNVTDVFRPRYGEEGYQLPDHTSPPKLLGLGPQAYTPPAALAALALPSAQALAGRNVAGASFGTSSPSGATPLPPSGGRQPSGPAPTATRLRHGVDGDGPFYDAYK